MGTALAMPQFPLHTISVKITLIVLDCAATTSAGSSAVREMRGSNPFTLSREV